MKRCGVFETAHISYAAGYLKKDVMDESLLAEAVLAAQTSDVAVLFLGLPDQMESEGYDRAHLRLPENQVVLLKEISKVNDNVVVVLSNGSAIEMPWIDHVNAILEGWLTGQASGSAVVDILFGKTNPSGKLQETFAFQLEDNPSYLNFPGVYGKVEYKESIFVGYRYYDKKKMNVLFPFGYGLSYTTFDYSNLRLSGDSIKDVDGLTVEVDVENIGDVDGSEIAQLYIHDLQARLIRPEQELKGFDKIQLKSGEKRTVRFHLEKRDYSYYNPHLKRWVMESGEFEIRVGKSSRDICLKQIVTVESTDQVELVLTGDSTVKDWLSTPTSRQALFDILAEEGMKEQIEHALQGEHAPMVKGMPLQKLFYFDPNKAEKADQILQKLLTMMKKGVTA